MSRLGTTVAAFSHSFWELISFVDDDKCCTMLIALGYIC